LELTDDTWYLLQCNYDHWNPTPDYDQRRDIGKSNMNAVGADNISLETLMDVLSKYPTLNHKTIYTTVYEPSQSSAVTVVRTKRLGGAMELWSDAPLRLDREFVIGRKGRLDSDN
jgi:hypothetical protein